ncbi:unnamed protein product [Ilex paraguariensis]|uniref:Uncharacterized protein n=1 Tax=Ilex paraguariensis TaxID=185542 RepID=A0ABC8TWC2_9AQUA
MEGDAVDYGYMMLGKRPRPSMRRMTNMTAIRIDMGDVEPPSLLDPQNTIISDVKKVEGPNEHIMEGPSWYYHRSMAILSPRCHMRGSGNSSMEMAHFLRTCGLCKCCLAPSCDIYSMKIKLVDQCFPNKNLVPKEIFRHQNRILQQRQP